MRAALVVLILAGTVRELAAQTLRPALEASVWAARVRSELPGDTRQLSGTAFGGQGTLSRGRLALSVNYLQGSVDPASGGGASRDLVEGRILLGVRPRPWLTVAAGPQVRAYVISGTTQRWVFWQLRARGEQMFIGSAVTGYAELWRALAGDVNTPEPFDHAQGGEAGIVVHLSRAPVEARFAYRIDHAVLGSGSRLETVEGVVVGVQLVRR